MDVYGNRKLFFDGDKDIIVLRPRDQWIKDELRSSKIRDAGMFFDVKILAVDWPAGLEAYRSNSNIFPQFSNLKRLMLVIQLWPLLADSTWGPAIRFRNVSKASGLIRRFKKWFAEIRQEGKDYIKLQGSDMQIPEFKAMSSESLDTDWI